MPAAHSPAARAPFGRPSMPGKPRPGLRVLVLMATAAVCAQKNNNPKPPKPPPPPRTGAQPGAAAKSPGTTKNPQAPKGAGAQRLANPGNPVERLMAMPPEKREQILERLPPQQQANLAQRLARFPQLTAPET